MCGVCVCVCVWWWSVCGVEWSGVCGGAIIVDLLVTLRRSICPMSDLLGLQC